MRRLNRLVTTAAIGAWLGGCAAAVPAVSALSAGAAAGEKGYSFWQSGRLYYVDEGTLEEMTLAVRAAIERLELTIRDEREDLDDGEVESRSWAIRSDRGHLLRLSLEPLTDAMISVELDTGAFGNRAAAELVAQRIKENLDAIHASAAPGVVRPDQPPPGPPGS